MAKLWNFILLIITLTFFAVVKMQGEEYYEEYYEEVSYPETNEEINDNLKNMVLKPLRQVDKTFIPTRNISQFLTITMNFALLSLTNFDELSGEINIVSFLKLTWSADNNPTWDKKMVGGKDSFSVTTDEIWTPSVIILNPAHTVKDLTSASNNVRILNNGTVYWEIIAGIEAACSVDVRNFPIDQQTCVVKLAPWGYYSHEIRVRGILDKTRDPYFTENSAWKLESIEVESVNELETPFLQITLNIRRLYQYFLMNVLMPPILLSILGPFVFLLPASSGERISFSITCFLSFSVFISMLSDNMPKSSAPIAYLSYFMMYMLIHSCCVVVSTIFTLKIYSKEATDQKVPRLLRILVNIARLQFCTLNVVNNNKKKNSSRKKPHLENEERFETPVENIADGNIASRRASVLQEVFVQRKYKKPMSKAHAWMDAVVTWEKVGRTLDWFFFFAYLSWMLFTVFSYLLSIGFI